jgi:hypothetical protein
VRRLSTFNFDLLGLCRALVLLLTPVIIIAGITTVMCAITYGAYLREPAFTRSFRFMTIDHLLLLEQLRRLREVPPSDVALFGDSSCLMGIDIMELRAQAPTLSIQSFCSLAFPGPAGYAMMLDVLTARGVAPRMLVIVLHPVQFDRQPSWDQWLPIVKNENISGAPDIGFPLAALDYVRFELLMPILYKPLPGAYSLFFGGATRLIAHLHANYGSTIDPISGLSFPSLNAFQSQRFATVPVTQSYPYSTNEAFDASLIPLADAIKRMRPQQTYLIISPIPQHRYGETSAAARATSAAKIAGRLDATFLASDPSLPAEYFSSETHLNRWGRILFSRSLSKFIQVSGNRQ